MFCIILPRKNVLEVGMGKYKCQGGSYKRYQSQIRTRGLANDSRVGSERLRENNENG